MDDVFKKWKSSRQGWLRNSTPACWDRQRKACGGIFDLCSSEEEEEEEEEEK